MFKFNAESTQNQRQPVKGVNLVRIGVIVFFALLGFKAWDWYSAPTSTVVASDVAAPVKADNQFYSVGQQLRYGPNIDLVIVGVDGDQITISDSDGDTQTVSMAVLENKDAFLDTGVRSLHQSAAELDAMRANAVTVPSCNGTLWFNMPPGGRPFYTCNGPGIIQTQAPVQTAQQPMQSPQRGTGCALSPNANYTPSWMPCVMRQALMTH